MNNWDETGKLVIHEIQRLANTQEEIQKEIIAIKIEIVKLQTKAGIVGGSVGAIVSGIAMGIKTLIGK